LEPGPGHSLNKTHTSLPPQALLDAMEAGDVEAFTNVVVDFDKMTKLDSWKTTILLRMKKSIGEESIT
jgi:alpha-soluble NSF attachment protein